jgi:hypothetical protein
LAPFDQPALAKPHEASQPNALVEGEPFVNESATRSRKFVIIEDFSRFNYHASGRGNRSLSDRSGLNYAPKTPPASLATSRTDTCGSHGRIHIAMVSEGTNLRLLHSE